MPLTKVVKYIAEQPGSLVQRMLAWLTWLAGKAILFFKSGNPGYKWEICWCTLAISLFQLLGWNHITPLRTVGMKVAPGWR